MPSSSQSSSSKPQPIVRQVGFTIGEEDGNATTNTNTGLGSKKTTPSSSSAVIGSSTNDVVATSKEENDDAAVASITAGFGSVLNVSSLHQQSPERKKTKEEKPVQEKEAVGAPAPPPPPPLPESDKDEEKKRKAEEKERRRQEHLARMASEGKPEPKLQKAASKAERRAQQEAQRAAKEQEKSSGGAATKKKQEKGGSTTTTTTTTTSKGGSAPSGSGDKSASTVGGGSTDETHRSFADVRTKTRKDSHFCERHFSHLNLHQTSTSNKIDHDLIEFQYPCVERLAEAYQTRKCVGSTNRVRQLLLCLKEVVQSYSHKSGSYSQALLVLINHVISRIQEARPISTSMGNAVKSLKTHLAVLSQGEKLKEARDDAEMMTVEAQKKKTLEHLEDTLKEYVERAVETIVKTLSTYYAEKQVQHVVTFGHSESVVKSLIRAKESGYENMCVTIVDAAPSFEGRKTLNHLLDADISCEYTLMHGMDVVFQRFSNSRDGADQSMVCCIGASAVLANGKIMSRAGSASFCNAAKSRGVKVLVAAETIKFHERVGIDSVLHNDIQDFVIEPGMISNLRKLCLSYDLVEDIGEIVCEKGIIAPGKAVNFVI
jgi:translation initiation factor eIF-2B subunit delta